MKKIFSVFLLAALTALWHVPVSTAEQFENKESLFEFIKSTDKISAGYEYPSVKISSSSAGKKKLSARTPVIIQSDEEINTKTFQSGDSVLFSVVQDVEDTHGNILIKSGTPVSANIDFEQKGPIGKSGKIIINDFHTTGVDGTYVPLSATISDEPDDRMVLSIVLSACICVLFLLMKGRDAKIPKGTTKTVYTFSDVYIKTISG